MTKLAHRAVWFALGCMSCDMRSTGWGADANISFDGQVGSPLDGSAGPSSADGFVASPEAGGADAATASGPQIETRLGELVVALSNFDLQSIDQKLDRLRFAAVVVGLPTVEVLEERDGVLSARTVARFDPPELHSRRAPLFVWPLDVDCDGVLDLAFAGLEDAYVVRGAASGEFGPREPWERYLPNGVGTNVLDARLVRGQIAAIVPYTTYHELRASVRAAGACNWVASSALPLPGSTTVGSFVTAWSDPSDALQLFVQLKGGKALRIDTAVSDRAVAFAQPTASRAAPMAPYVGPFDSVFAQVPLPRQQSCPERFLGVGDVHQPGSSDDTRRALTRLEVFSLQDDRHIWKDVPETSGLEAYGVSEGASPEEPLIGVIRSLGQSGHEFLLFRQHDCMEAELLARIPVDYDWRSPRAPLQGRSPGDLPSDTPGFVPHYRYPALLATKTLATASGPRVLFAHYDGYDGRLVEARENAGSWSLTFHKSTIHEDRDDLSFPFSQADVVADRMRDGGADR